MVLCVAGAFLALFADIVNPGEDFELNYEDAIGFVLALCYAVGLGNMIKKKYKNNIVIDTNTHTHTHSHTRTHTHTRVN